MNLTLSQLDLPVRIRPVHGLSDEELFAFCSANELLRVERDANGELIVMSPGGLEGGGAELEIGTDLTNWARQDGRGKSFGSNAGFTLPDGGMRSPDAAWMSWERWNGLSREEQKRFGRVVPEFVVELRYETVSAAELQEKMQMWVANGVELAWLIDPQRRVVEIYRAGDEVEVHQDPSSVQGTGPVRGFELVMSRVWG